MFLWFYCLSIPRVLLLASAAVLLVWSADLLGYRKKFWRPLMLLLFICWFLAVAGKTVFLRKSGSGRAPEWHLFASYRAVMAGGNPEILRSNLMNVILFLPGGMFLSMAFPHRKHIWLWILLEGICLTAFSAGIEYCQFRFQLGYAETDDIFHNGLGAFLGAFLGTVPTLLRNRYPKLREFPWKKLKN